MLSFIRLVNSNEMLQDLLKKTNYIKKLNKINTLKNNRLK